MLQAMNTGHEGSLSTCHANGPLDALRRLETLRAHGRGRACPCASRSASRSPPRSTSSCTWRGRRRATCVTAVHEVGVRAADGDPFARASPVTTSWRSPRRPPRAAWSRRPLAARDTSASLAAAMLAAFSVLATATSADRGRRRWCRRRMLRRSSVGPRCDGSLSEMVDRWARSGAQVARRHPAARRVGDQHLADALDAVGSSLRSGATCRVVAEVAAGPGVVGRPPRRWAASVARARRSNDRDPRVGGRRRGSGGRARGGGARPRGRPRRADAAEAVDGVVATLRDRSAVAAESRALATQATASVGVLVAAPVAFAVVAASVDGRVLGSSSVAGRVLACLASVGPRRARRLVDGPPDRCGSSSISGPALAVVLGLGSSPPSRSVSAARHRGRRRPSRVDQLVQPSLGHPVGSPAGRGGSVDGARPRPRRWACCARRLVGRPISAQRVASSVGRC